jgi:hypothetical protein
MSSLSIGREFRSADCGNCGVIYSVEPGENVETAALYPLACTILGCSNINESRDADFIAIRVYWTKCSAEKSLIVVGLGFVSPLHCKGHKDFWARILLLLNETHTTTHIRMAHSK